MLKRGDELMPLTMIDEGTPYTIQRIGGKEEIRRFLENLGLSVGQTVKVTRLNGDGPVKRRIMDMGITKGVEVYVRKVAPLGDPVEITVRGYELSLRKADAEMIEVG